MQLSDLNRLLDVALDKVENRIYLTVTEPPDGEPHLLGILASAIKAGKRHRSSLSEIQISREAYPAMGLNFLDIPVTDSGDPGVVRLIYDPEVGTRTV